MVNLYLLVESFLAVFSSVVGIIKESVSSKSSSYMSVEMVIFRFSFCNTGGRIQFFEYIVVCYI